MSHASLGIKGKSLLGLAGRSGKWRGYADGGVNAWRKEHFST